MLTAAQVAIEVHKSLGPGYIEAFYEHAFCIELSRQEIPFQRQLSYSVAYKDIEIGSHRIDLVVDRRVVVELKASRQLEDVHTAQVLSYLKASSLQVGLLINFSGATVRVKRVARTLPKTTAE